uniref:Chaperonin family protein n=1 Tax=Rhizophora mucronata TaxID=61149 RepID=A0A2P2MJ46_RHIMU
MSNQIACRSITSYQILWVNPILYKRFGFLQKLCCK